MKVSNIFLCVVALMGGLSFSSCSNEEENITDNSRQPLEIELSPITRTALESKTLPDNSSYAILCNNKTSGVIYAKGISTIQTPIYVDDISQRVYAIYPYSDKALSALSNGSYLDVETNSQTDYMFGQSSNYVTRSNPKATIALNHIMTRVTLNIYKLAEEQKEYTLYDVTFNNIGVKGSYDWKNGSYNNVVKNNYTFKTGASRKVTAETPITVDLLCIPTGRNTVELSLNLGNNTMKTSISTNWVMGKQHIYTVTIDEGGRLNVSSVRIVPWSTGETLSGTLDTGEPRAKAIDLGLSVRWASCNLGASKPEEYGGYYSWGETAIKSNYNDVNYSLSKVEDYKGEGIIDANDNLTSKYDAATVNWGSEWRMPTLKEMQELVEKCEWTWTILNGWGGYTVKGSNGQSIFLPVAGYIIGTPYGIGETGNYWTATKGSHTLTFTFNSVGRPTIEINKDYFGQSIRPVMK